MADFFLDLRDKPRVVDFLVAALPYAPEAVRAEAEERIKRYHDGEHVATDALAETARTLAMTTWPARYAVKRYVTHEGAGEEWKSVAASLRSSTAQSVKRLRASTGAASLGAVLAHPEAVEGLSDDERQEIRAVCHEVREAIWKDKRETLSISLADGQKELEGYQKRFQRLREVVTKLPPTLQDEVFSKIAHYEDRIIFEGEIVPMEILDQEVKYYIEQAEISPLEE